MQSLERLQALLGTLSGGRRINESEESCSQRLQLRKQAIMSLRNVLYGLRTMPLSDVERELSDAIRSEEKRLSSEHDVANSDVNSIIRGSGHSDVTARSALRVVGISERLARVRQQIDEIYETTAEAAKAIVTAQAGNRTHRIRVMRDEDISEITVKTWVHRKMGTLDNEPAHDVCAQETSGDLRSTHMGNVTRHEHIDGL